MGRVKGKLSREYSSTGYFAFLARQFLSALAAAIVDVKLVQKSMKDRSESNPEAIDEFLTYATRASWRRLAMEFWDRSCFGDEMQAVRFHGPREMFASSYSDTELQCWAKAMKIFLKQRRDVYAYFNNDSGGHARRNAQVLLGHFESSRNSLLHQTSN